MIVVPLASYFVMIRPAKALAEAMERTAADLGMQEAQLWERAHMGLCHFGEHRDRAPLLDALYRNLRLPGR